MFRIRPALVVTGFDVETCSSTGEVVRDRRDRPWDIMECGGKFRAQMGLDKSPLGSISGARSWAAEQGAVQLEAGETKVLVGAVAVIIGLALAYALVARLVA